MSKKVVVYLQDGLQLEKSIRLFKNLVSFGRMSQILRFTKQGHHKNDYKKSNNYDCHSFITHYHYNFYWIVHFI